MGDQTAVPAHWADETARAVVADGRPPVVSSGISPSGEIHIGNMREVLTADAVFRALRDGGAEPRFNYVADNFDPLRRVYPFLDPAVYAPLVGRPLSEIPCPCGEHDSYAEHFLAPFLESLRRLHVEVEVERADRLYKSGRMNDVVVEALRGRDRIAAILSELTGKEVPEDWSPYNPLCPECGRITGTAVTGFSAEARTVDYACSCGARGTVPMAGGGKLTWRVDWPARWKSLGVTVEPFGKDHATRGGSYDTGVRISREVFHREPPLPLAYEWIRLKGQGDMSSSKGNVLSIAQALEVVPPEALRYLVMRERPSRTIAFDPGVPLLDLVDQMEDAGAEGRDSRAVDLSRAAGFRPLGVPFRHLVMVAQAVRFDLEGVREALSRGGYGGVDTRALEDRLAYARRWLQRFAPEDMRFEVRDTVPAESAGLAPAQRLFLTELAASLREGMDGEAVHALIYDLAQRTEGMSAADAFRAIYLALLGKTRGPRAGAFVALLGPSFCARRFREAAAVS
jgi:lysyl-tRNA synthetase class 1